MIAHIVCGSPNLWLPEHLEGYIVGVDRGALKLVENNIDFDVAIGDFDSVNRDEKIAIKNKAGQFVELAAEKDMTDCEAAIEYTVANGWKEIYLYGATGGRLDHQLAVIALMLKYAKQGIQIYMVDAQNKLFVLLPGMHGIKVENKRYLSFFALERSVRALTLTGVKYPLDCYDLTVDDARCVSNEAITKKVGISFGIGYLLVVQSSD